MSYRTPVWNAINKPKIDNSVAMDKQVASVVNTEDEAILAKDHAFVNMLIEETASPASSINPASIIHDNGAVLEDQRPTARKKAPMKTPNKQSISPAQAMTPTTTASPSSIAATLTDDEILKGPANELKGYRLLQVAQSNTQQEIVEAFNANRDKDAEKMTLRKLTRFMDAALAEVAAAEGRDRREIVKDQNQARVRNGVTKRKRGQAPEEQAALTAKKAKLEDGTAITVGEEKHTAEDSEGDSSAWDIAMTDAVEGALGSVQADGGAAQELTTIKDGAVAENDVTGADQGPGVGVDYALTKSAAVDAPKETGTGGGAAEGSVTRQDSSSTQRSAKQATELGQPVDRVKSGVSAGVGALEGAEADNGASVSDAVEATKAAFREECEELINKRAKSLVTGRMPKVVGDWLKIIHAFKNPEIAEKINAKYPKANLDPRKVSKKVQNAVSAVTKRDGKAKAVVKAEIKAARKHNATPMISKGKTKKKTGASSVSAPEEMAQVDGDQVDDDDWEASNTIDDVSGTSGQAEDYECPLQDLEELVRREQATLQSADGETDMPVQGAESTVPRVGAKMPAVERAKSNVGAVGLGGDVAGMAAQITSSAVEDTAWVAPDSTNPATEPTILGEDGKSTSAAISK